MHAFLFLKSPLLSGMDQTKQVYCNNDKGRIYQDFEFQYPWGRDYCARAWFYAVYSSENVIPGINQTN